MTGKTLMTLPISGLEIDPPKPVRRGLSPGSMVLLVAVFAVPALAAMGWGSFRTATGLKSILAVNQGSSPLIHTGARSVRWVVPGRLGGHAGLVENPYRSSHMKLVTPA